MEALDALEYKGPDDSMSLRELKEVLSGRRLLPNSKATETPSRKCNVLPDCRCCHFSLQPSSPTESKSNTMGSKSQAPVSIDSAPSSAPSSAPPVSSQTGSALNDMASVSQIPVPTPSASSTAQAGPSQTDSGLNTIASGSQEIQPVHRNR